MRNIHAGLSSNRDRTGLDGMVKLAMASFLSYLLPTIRFKQSNKVFDFHSVSLAWSLLDAQLQHA